MVKEIYAYVGSNPLLYADQLGLVCVWCEGANAVIAAGVTGVGALIESPVVIAFGLGWEIGTGIYAGYEAYESFNNSLQTQQQNENTALGENSNNPAGNATSGDTLINQPIDQIIQPIGQSINQPVAPPQPPRPPNACGT